MPKTESSRAKTLLRKINKELSTIPDYDFKPSSLKMGSTGSSVLKAVNNAGTALRRGLRKLQGGESKPSLELKRKRVKDLIAETKEMKEMAFDVGTKPLSDADKSKRKFTTLSKSDYIASGNKRRREMKLRD